MGPLPDITRVTTPITRVKSPQLPHYFRPFIGPHNSIYNHPAPGPTKVVLHPINSQLRFICDTSTPNDPNKKQQQIDLPDLSCSNVIKTFRISYDDIDIIYLYSYKQTSRTNKPKSKITKKKEQSAKLAKLALVAALMFGKSSKHILPNGALQNFINHHGKTK